MTDHTMPPHDHEAEQALLGSLLIDRDAILAVAGTVSPGDFYSTANGTIYAAMRVLFRKREPVDLVTLSHELTRVGKLDQVGGMAAIASLLGVTPTSVHAPYYAGIVAETAAKRRLIAAATKIVGLGYDPDLDSAAALSEARKLLSTVSPESRGGKGVTMAEALESLAVELDARWEGTWVDHVVPTGLHDLDRKLTGGGFEPGQFIVIGARPGAGKTALFMQIALNASRHAQYTQQEPAWSVFFSSEMTTRAICFRALAEATQIPIRQLKQGRDETGRTLPHEVKERIGARLEEMMSLPLWIDDTSSPTTEQMHERIERLRMDRPVLMGGFDYLEQAGNVKGRGENEENRLSEVAAGLKKIAKTTEIPMVGLAQLNREVEKRADKTPTLADLRQSGRIEQEADIVLLLYREDYYVAQGMVQPTPGKQGTADIKIEKQRDGETGVVTVQFVPELTSFRSLDRRIA